MIAVKHDKLPLPHYGSNEYQAIEQFRQEVVIVIQSCNDNEYYASLELMEAPVRYRNEYAMRIILGMFAGYNAAIAYTQQGSSCRSDIEEVLKWCPNTKAILGVGVAYGMKRDAVKFGDVLVAKQIANVGTNPRVMAGGIYPRAPGAATKPTLMHTFCQAYSGWEFSCTKKQRQAKVKVGEMVSGGFLLDDSDIKETLKMQCPFAEGGEMEGWILYKDIMEKHPNLEVIVIKGVADYGDGKKNKEWQFTAAKAAVDYTRYKLLHDQPFHGMNTIYIAQLPVRITIRYKLWLSHTCDAHKHAIGVGCHFYATK